MPQETLASPVRSIPPDARDGPPQKGIALCLSGGGYRAMIFHVGALWRLNEAGLLGKLARVSSVSGGSITAAVLGMNWGGLAFDPAGVATKFDTQLVDPIRGLADRTIDQGAVIGGILLPGTISDKVAKAYEKHLFKDRTLQNLPPEGAGPRFVINATNVQTGSLWRFSQPYMGDWQVGLIRQPKVKLAKAVAASSAFPPVLSPCHLDVNPGDFDPTTNGDFDFPPYNDEVVLSDGGVYDNLGLETAYKRQTTILVSDGGQKMSPEPEPKGDWAQHAIRIMGVIDNQVRSLRKRILIEAYQRGDRTGAYWGIATHYADYQLPADPLGAAGRDPTYLASTPTRLKRMPADTQERLINWGYTVCDAALRKHWNNLYDVTINPPKGFPYAQGY
jgi:NTE family protein